MARSSASTFDFTHKFRNGVTANFHRWCGRRIEQLDVSKQVAQPVTHGLEDERGGVVLRSTEVLAREWTYTRSNAFAEEMSMRTLSCLMAVRAGKGFFQTTLRMSPGGGAAQCSRHQTNPYCREFLHAPQRPVSGRWLALSPRWRVNSNYVSQAVICHF